MKDAVDFSDARPSPKDLADRELDALVYTGNSRPSQAYIDQLRSYNIVITFIQESTSTRSQQGYQAGRDDCYFAESRARERGHTGSIAVVVSDGSWVDAWDCLAYGQGWQSVATLPFFSYGSVGCCQSFNTGAPASLGTWIPETWGTGTLMTQHVGPSPVAGTDFNTVHADYTGGLVADMDTLGLWMQEQASNVVKLLEAYIDKKFAQVVPGGGVTADQVRAIVREELNKTKLAG